MSGINIVLVAGHVTNTPQMRQTASGTPITNFTVVTSFDYTDRVTGKKCTSTEWHKVVARNKLAEIAVQFCFKGRLVFLIGRINTRKWVPKGAEHTDKGTYVTEIVLQKLQVWGPSEETILKSLNQDGENTLPSFLKCDANSDDREDEDK